MYDFYDGYNMMSTDVVEAGAFIGARAHVCALV